MLINHDQTSLAQKYQQGKKKEKKRKQSNLQVKLNQVVMESKPRWRIHRDWLI